MALTITLLAGLGFCAAGAGRLLLNRPPLTFSSRGELLFFSTALGFGTLGYAVFALGVLDLLRPLFLYLLLGLFAVVGLAGWAGPARTAPALSGPPAAGEDRIAVPLLGIVLFLAFLLMLTPAVGKDALIYHLAVPKLFLKHRGLYVIPGNIFANYPLLGEMLFLVGLFLQGDTLAKGLHFLALPCILLGIGQFVRFHMQENRFPALSMLLFCTIPTVFITATLAYNDLFITWYCLAAVLAFVHWSEKTQPAWLAVCGLFTGLALATKYTALLWPLLGCLGVLWIARAHRLRTGTALKHLFCYLLAAIIVGSPFYLRNWLVTGNPVYPFLYALFGGRGWEPDQARLYDLLVQNLGMGRGLLDYLLLPWNLSFRAKMDSPWFDGVLGPVFFLVLPFTLTIRRLEPTLKTALVFAGFTFLFWTFSAQQLRYLMPLFPFLAVTAGAIFSHAEKGGNRKLLLILAILAAAGITVSGYHISRHFLKIQPTRVITGRENRAAFLRRRLPSAGIFQYADKHLPPDAKVFLIYMRNWGFLLDRAYYSDSMFESYTIQKLLDHAPSTAAAYRELTAGGFTHILFDARYVYGPASTFSAREKTLFLALQKEYLTLIKQDGPYFLYRLEPPGPRHFLP